MIKTINFSNDKQRADIQAFADKYFSGNFSGAVIFLLSKGLESQEGK